MSTSDDAMVSRPSPGRVGEQARGAMGERTVSSVPTVLFVDDEPDVLDSLRVCFRRHREDFELRFAGSADEAMALMEHEPVDLVVTDMRMPVRSGADLLEELRFRHPDVIRFVLSGQAEDRLVHRSVAVSHRWLSKPCDHEVLLAAIAEATARRSEIDDPLVRRAIGTIDALPSHPEAFRTLVDELARPGITIDEVVGAAAADPAVTVKLLQWANSVYGDGRPVYDVRRAVERIGIEALTRLSSAEEMVRPSTPSEVIPGFGIDLFHRHARMVAGIAAGLTDPERADLAGAAGLLSGVGLLIEVRYLQKRLIMAYQRAEEVERSLLAVERETLGLCHTELAGHLLRLWGLPGDLVTAVTESHAHPDPAATLPLSPIDAVRAARLLVQRSPLGRAIGSPHLLSVDAEIEASLARWSAQIDRAAAG